MNRYQVKFSTKSKEWIFNITKFIALDNPARANSFIDEMVDWIKSALSIFPLGSPVYDVLNTGVEIRLYVYWNYNCYYYFSEKSQTVNVLFIFHWAKKINKMMFEDVDKSFFNQ